MAQSLVAVDPLLAVYVLVFTVAALSCFGSMYRLRHIEDADTRRGLLGLVGLSGIWAGSQVGFLIGPSQWIKLGNYYVGLVAGFAAVGSWLYFCSAYTGREYHRESTYRWAGIVVFLVVTVVKLTNPVHGYYFSTREVLVPFAHLAVETGVLHWTTMGLAYALAFVGLFMVFELFQAVEFETTGLGVLLGLMGAPVVVDIISVVSTTLVELTYEPLGVAMFAVGVGFVYTNQFEAVQFAAERDVPIIALDADDRIRDTNQAVRTLFPVLEGSAGKELGDCLPKVAEKLDSETPIVTMEVDGEPRYLRITASPLGTGAQELGRTVVFEDVTDEERYRQELQRQNQRLEEFASMVSHDLRNPLTVAEGRLALARDELQGENENLGDVAAALDRMEELIDDVLALARHGQPIDRLDAIDLAEIAAESWEMVGRETATLTVEESVQLMGDPDRVKRVFENLFRNAVEHGGENVAIKVGRLADESGFYVEDSGPGIPPDQQSEVLEAGYTTQENGTGFGLAIVAEIVDAHGWSLRVTDSDGGGARFEIAGVEVVSTST